MRIFTLIIAVFTFLSLSNAQSVDQFEQKALEYIDSQVEEWDLESKDINEMKLVDAYTGSRSGVHHLYFVQRWNGTDIYNAVTGIHLDQNGEILHAAPRVYRNLEDRIHTYDPSISAETAVKTAARYMGVQQPTTQKMAALTNGIDQDVITFDAGNISKRPIPARLVYQEDQDGNLRLAWDISVDLVDDIDWLSVRIDATNGALLSEVNWAVKCQFGEKHTHTSRCLERQTVETAESISTHEAQYNVFPFPYESPLDGSRELVSNPSDSVASPFGWHDTNGDEDPDFTTTRGNNTRAFTDRNGDLEPDFDVDGGMDLTFDFPFDQLNEPQDYAEASAVNLFYAINMIHDIAYHYGFDEAAGNFQAMNYTGAGEGGDEVLGGSDFDADGSSINNATFSTPPDGGNGVMRMFEWNNSAADQEFVEVIQPAEVRGFYATGTAEFGLEITASDTIRGEVAIAEDGIQLSTDACEDINNGEELDGKIAMIDRGNCDFSLKVYNAQQEGAIAVIICNNQGNGIIGMAGGTNANQVTIPSLFMSREDCNQLRVYAGNTLELELKLPAPATGAERYSGSLDNGIIAHEFGHGISNRLTGGPSAAGCLGNDEQMGEGWSDFFTLVTTAKPGDAGTDSRGIGNYVQREDKDGRGIRNFPYSTDMGVNPQTYEDVILSGTAPHPLGEIWCTMLWDLYWALVDEYGWDPDIKYGDGGNNIAIQLVMEGMALQACSPGFVDGRDAILAADEALYSGDHQCLIWEVFARRGLGYSADQGDTDDRGDAKEAFDVPPSCTKDMFIDKSVSPVVERGDEIEVTLKLSNFTSDLQEDIILTDVLPEGCTYVDGSANVEPTEVSGDMITFELLGLNPDQSNTITYTMLSPESNASSWIEEEGFNSDTVTQEWFTGSFEGPDQFNWVEGIGVDGTPAFTIDNTAAENDHYLFNLNGHAIEGENPVMRFTHYYNIEPGNDGGIVEISNDGGITFHDAGDLMFRNPYRGKLAYTTFAIVNQRAFWGESDGWITTYLDLSPFKGEHIIVRFRFGSVEGGGAEGWIIDDFHLFDMLNYNTEATVMYGDGETNTGRAEGKGTIVEPDLEVSTTPAIVRKNQLQLFPNPAKEQVYIQIPQTDEEAEYSIFNLHGKKVMDGEVNKGVQHTSLQVDQLSGGIYFIEMIQGNTLYTGKVILQ